MQPAGPPPPGVHSNFVNPVNHAPNLIACNVILLVVSTLVVGARILSRTLLTDWRLGWDDCTCLCHTCVRGMTGMANMQKTLSSWPLYAHISRRWGYRVDVCFQVGTAVFGSFVIESQS